MDRHLDLRAGRYRPQGTQTLKLAPSLYQILQVAGVTIFERTPILQAFQQHHAGEKSDSFSNQLSLLDL